MLKNLAVIAILAGVSLYGVARADVITGGGVVRVTFSSSMTPKTLPRTRSEPISITVAGSVDLIGNRRPTGLRKFVVSFNRHARVTTSGLPPCPEKSVGALKTRQALEVCGDSLVGTGHFTAHVDLPDQSPFPSVGRALVFYTSDDGRPALLAHVYGPKPIPTVETMLLAMNRDTEGNYGLTLSARMPQVGNDWGYVTGFDLTLKRSYRHRGRTLDFLAAACPAPQGVFVAPFRIARGTFFLEGGEMRTRVVSGACRVRPERPRGRR